MFDRKGGGNEMAGYGVALDGGLDRLNGALDDTLSGGRVMFIIDIMVII